MLECFNNKKQHVGKLKPLYYFYDPVDETETVVNWCPNCGAIAIDLEVDNRLMNSVVKMQFPNMIKDK